MNLGRSRSPGGEERNNSSSSSPPLIYFSGGSGLRGSNRLTRTRHSSSPFMSRRGTSAARTRWSGSNSDVQNPKSLVCGPVPDDDDLPQYDSIVCLLNNPSSRTGGGERQSRNGFVHNSAGGGCSGREEREREWEPGEQQDEQPEEESPPPSYSEALHLYSFWERKEREERRKK